jgi:hypothetical protein
VRIKTCAIFTHERIVANEVRGYRVLERDDSIQKDFICQM